MHQALLIDEILRDIFDECGKGALGVAARTCRAWKDPALDHLWRVLPTVGPLLALFPQLRYEGKRYVLSSDPTQADITSVSSYARRVRQIVVRSDLALPPVLHAALSGIFPRVSAIRLAGNAGDSALQLFVSAALSTLDLDTSRGSALQSTLAHLPARCPHLTTLRIRGPITDDCDAALRALPDLRTLSLKLGSSLRPAAVAALARLPHLESLELLAEHLDVDALPATTSNLFPSLHRLHLRAHAHIAIAFLDLLPRDALRSLRIDLEDTALPPETARAVFTAIASAGARSLTALTLEWHRDGEGELSAAALAPLRGLARLRQLVLDTRAMPDLADGELEKLAQGWREMEYLELGSAPLLEPGARAEWACRGTLGSLGVLARACPRLRVLMLPLDAAKGGEGGEAAEAEEPAPQSSVERLSVWSPTVFQPPAMAGTLKATFTALKAVDGSPEHENLWAKVREAMGLLCVQTVMDVCM
ncbi:hypothetical protein HDZ31DRAFT_80129 [Schizophyllum fasciatum]